MRNATLIRLSAAITLLSCAGGAGADVVETRELEETVPVARGEPLVVIVKNITGPVHVAEHDRDGVEMRATETIRGDLQADVERARRELALVTETEQGRIAFRVRRLGDDGEPCDCERGHWGFYDDYVVEYDIEVLVPRGTAVDLSTINDGDVSAEGLSGDFTVANVNGDIRLTGLTGGGDISSVNGDVEAAFARAPARASEFRTVNGDLDVAFPADLSANLEFRTVHGDVFTDFEIEALRPAPTANRDRTRGMFMMRTRPRSAYRVGAGGATHSFDTVNGEIYVRKATQ